MFVNHSWRVGQPWLVPGNSSRSMTQSLTTCVSPCPKNITGSDWRCRKDKRQKTNMQKAGVRCAGRSDGDAQQQRLLFCSFLFLYFLSSSCTKSKNCINIILEVSVLRLALCHVFFSIAFLKPIYPLTCTVPCFL
jgi:hypothetical protein